MTRIRMGRVVAHGKSLLLGQHPVILATNGPPCKVFPAGTAEVVAPIIVAFRSAKVLPLSQSEKRARDFRARTRQEEPCRRPDRGRPCCPS